MKNYHNNKTFKMLTTTAVLVGLTTNTSFAQSPDAITFKTSETLAAFKATPKGRIKNGDIVGYKVTKSEIDPDIASSVKFGASDSKLIPFSANGSMIISLEPNLSKEDISNMLETYNLELETIYSNIDTIHVKMNFEQYFKADPKENHVLYLRGLINTALYLQLDERIASVAPDTILTAEETNLPYLEAFDFTYSDVEVTDWGIANIQADKLWNNPRSKDGITIGILDAGFGRHEDISFTKWPKQTKRHDHGNHVAGIACAKHNGIGVKGVLPNCFVKPASSKKFAFQSVPQSYKMKFLMSFNQTINSVHGFIEQEDGISVYNLSLGYNWIPNFAINIDKPINEEQRLFRNIVEMQSISVVRLLEYAKQKDKVIYSAAGNDSNNLIADPMDALYSSPFNFGAIMAREKGISTNGVIVEAHDSAGKRATFSNEKGNISCPGVRIMSAVAYDDNGKRSSKTYAKKSGTSMASPYCAWGHLLFKLIRTKYSNSEAVNCLIISAKESTTGAPQMKLENALKACPPK